MNVEEWEEQTSQSICSCCNLHINYPAVLITTFPYPRYLSIHTYSVFHASDQKRKKKKKSGRNDRSRGRWTQRWNAFFHQISFTCESINKRSSLFCHCCFRQLNICKCFNWKILLTVRLPGELLPSQPLFWCLKEDIEVRIAALAWDFGAAPLEWDQIIKKVSDY